LISLVNKFGKNKVTSCLDLQLLRRLILIIALIMTLVSD